jgi:hypothetical protein
VGSLQIWLILKFQDRVKLILRIDIHFHVHRSRKGNKPGHEEVKSIPQGSSSPASDKFSVLLVEYDTCDRLFNKTQIIDFGKEYNIGMEVKVAKSGQKAIHLHSQGASFDLILMDMDMPAHVTSGYEVEFFDLQLRRIYFRSLRQSLKEETTTIR